MTYTLVGRCHCGSISVRLETPTDPRTLQLRACDCSFCSKHGGNTVSDPKGCLTFTTADPAKLTRYRFGLKSADFLLCAECGVYLGAYMEHEGRGYAVLNINTLEDRAPFDRPAEPMSYGAEAFEDRIVRRTARWTPAEIRIG